MMYFPFVVSRLRIAVTGQVIGFLWVRELESPLGYEEL